MNPNDILNMSFIIEKRGRVFYIIEQTQQGAVEHFMGPVLEPTDNGSARALDDREHLDAFIGHLYRTNQVDHGQLDQLHKLAKEYLSKI